MLGVSQIQLGLGNSLRTALHFFLSCFYPDTAALVKVVISAFVNDERLVEI